MKKLLLALSLCFSAVSFAQVGVGTPSPDASAQLDVQAEDKGILIPRLNIVDLGTAAPVSASDIKESLLAYNVNSTSGKGYYYWEGSRWVPLAGSSGSTTVTGGKGGPTNSSPANPKAGDIYVDESTGNIFIYNGTTWVNTSKVVSADANNVVKEGSDKLAFLDAKAIKAASGVSSGSGAPTSANPANAKAGDLYVDNTTGDIYTHNGNGWVKAGDGGGSTVTHGNDTPKHNNPEDPNNPNNPKDPQTGDIYVDNQCDIYTFANGRWTNKSKVVSADANNVVKEGSDKLAFLDAEAIKAASGVSSGSGAPTSVNPTGAEAGDIYVDEDTGDIYTHNGNDWVKSGDGGGPTVTRGDTPPVYNNPEDLNNPNNPNNPQTGDIYVDNQGDIHTFANGRWTNKSKVVSADANNVVEEGSDKLAFLDADAIKAASGVYSDSGAPTPRNPLGAEAGDIYVDEDTGDIYTHNGNDWVKSGDGGGPTVSRGDTPPVYNNPEDLNNPNNPNNPQAGDIYVDNQGDIYTFANGRWTNKSTKGNIESNNDNTISVTGGVDAALKDVTLSVNVANLRNIPARSLAAGTSGQVLTTANDGTVTWSSTSSSTDDQKLELEVGAADTAVIKLEDGDDITIKVGEGLRISEDIPTRTFTIEKSNVNKVEVRSNSYTIRGTEDIIIFHGDPADTLGVIGLLLTADTSNIPVGKLIYIVNLVPRTLMFDMADLRLLTTSNASISGLTGSILMYLGDDRFSMMHGY